LDYSFTSPAEITDQQITLYFNATIYDKISGYLIPSEIQIDDIGNDTESPDSIQIDLSQFTVDSLLVALQNTG